MSERRIDLDLRGFVVGGLFLGVLAVGRVLLLAHQPISSCTALFTAAATSCAAPVST